MASGSGNENLFALVYFRCDSTYALQDAIILWRKSATIATDFTAGNVQEPIETTDMAKIVNISV